MQTNAQSALVPGKISPSARAFALWKRQSPIRRKKRPESSYWKNGGAFTRAKPLKLKENSEQTLIQKTASTS